MLKLHFEDCPYHCNSNGKVLDVKLKQMIDCPHCSEKRKIMIKEGYAESDSDTKLPLSTVLGIENKYLSANFVYGSVVPEGECLFIEDDSLSWQADIAENLYLGLTVGTLPEESMCFGISIKGRVEYFAYPMLAKAYLAGLTVGRFITCSEFSRLSFDVANPMDEFYNSDYLMMMINDGSNLSDISSAKGLMQTRALKGKPTVFVTTWTIEACSALLGFNNDNNLSLAKPVFLKYKSSKNKKQSSYINRLLGVENEDLSVSSEKSYPSVSMDDLFNM